MDVAVGWMVSTFQAPSPLRITKYRCVGSNWFLEPDPTEICHQAHQTRANSLGGYRDQLNNGEGQHSLGVIGPEPSLDTVPISCGCSSLSRHSAREQYLGPFELKRACVDYF